MSRIFMWLENQIEEMKQKLHALQVSVAQAAITNNLDQLPENVAVEMAKLEGAIKFGEQALFENQDQDM